MTDMTREEALAHFGVKGQKWGVRNEDKLVGRDPAKKAETGSDKAKQNELTKKYMAIKPPKVSKEKDAQMHAESKAKFKEKFKDDPSDPDAFVGQEKKGWRPTNKQIATVALGAAVVGIGLYAYGKQSSKGGYDFNAKALDNLKNLQASIKPGDHVSFSDYSSLSSASSSRAWGSAGYIRDSSFIGEQTISAGTVFHRLTTSAATGFRDSTYCVPSMEDYARYASEFSKELGPAESVRHVTWTATKEVRVSGLTNTLETMRQALSERSGKEASFKQAKAMYESYSGGGWDHNDPIIKSFTDKLKSQGYHAIVDEMDAGVIGQNPLVLFDPTHMTKKIGTSFMAENFDHIESILTEINNRK